jgi:2-oxoglutarate ferredoxin oxidoreductase subunit delta
VGDARTAPSRRAPIAAQPAKIHGLVFIRKAHCKGCELCIEFCPKSVLVRSKGFNAKGYHYPMVANGECINCRLCVTVCPEYAIFSVAAAGREKGPVAAATNTGGRV